MSSLKEELSTLATCVTLERSDGVGIALTSCDRAIRVNQIKHEPVPGFVPHAVQEGDAGEQTTELTSALNTDLIRASDIRLGRWDGARVRLTAASWEAEEEMAELLVGRIGEITSHGDVFTAEFSSRSMKLALSPCPATTPECRAALGDQKCRIALGPLQQRARIIAINGFSLELDRAIGADFQFGTARIVSGRASGLRQPIVDTTATSIRLREVDRVIAVGDQLILTPGCDKRPETCRMRFSNMVNFRGEPQIPGTDFLMRYPGA